MKRTLPLALLLLTHFASADTCDIAIYSGVPCGIAAAVAAGREGADVVLIEPTRHVGGLNTSGICTAESEHMLKWTFGGIALEFYQRLGKHYGSDKPFYYFESKTAEQVFKGVDVVLAIGVRYSEVSTGFYAQPQRPHLIHVDINAENLGRIMGAAAETKA